MLTDEQKANARRLPIFKPRLRQSIRDRRKTQTRRVIDCCCNHNHLGRLLGTWGLSEPPHIWDGDENFLWNLQGRRPKPGEWVEQYQTEVDDHACQRVSCPYGKPGDIAYLREPLWEAGDGGVLYRDDGDAGEEVFEPSGMPAVWEWKRDTLPSIHMPRWAARTFVRLTDIRVERLQDISEGDAIAEGIFVEHCIVGTNGNGGIHCEEYEDRYFDGITDGQGEEYASKAFEVLWSEINGEESWSLNPWVWVVCWEPVE